MAPPSPRWRALLPYGALAALALVLGLLASTRLSISGAWYGLYLLEQKSGRPLELKDDLRLGDGRNLIGGISFSGLRELVAPGSDTALPRLDLEWSEEEGGGIIRNHLADGTELVTLFGRYVDSDGRTPHGLFVGGAIPDVAAGGEKNESGMAFRNALGWHHVWCNVNEGVLDDATGRMIFPGQWRYLGSQVEVEADDRVVLESTHEFDVTGGTVRVERFAYFRAGLPFFRLGVNFMNVGDEPVKISYTYGDEPWVGEFGSSAGNLGWVTGEIVPVVAFVDTARHGVAGIVDMPSGTANFMAWSTGARPDRAYFGNRPGTPDDPELGQPLASNAIFVGAEWLERRLDPGETLNVQLTLGLAPIGPRHVPVLPPGVRER